MSVKSDLRWLTIDIRRAHRVVDRTPDAAALVEPLDPAGLAQAIDGELRFTARRYRRVSLASMCIALVPGLFSIVTWIVNPYLLGYRGWGMYDRGPVGFLSIYEWLSFSFLALYLWFGLSDVRSGHRSRARLSAYYRRAIDLGPDERDRLQEVLDEGALPRAAAAFERGHVLERAAGPS